MLKNFVKCCTTKAADDAVIQRKQGVEMHPKRNHDSTVNKRQIVKTSNECAAVNSVRSTLRATTSNSRSDTSDVSTTADSSGNRNTKSEDASFCQESIPSSRSPLVPTTIKARLKGKSSALKRASLKMTSDFETSGRDQSLRNLKQKSQRNLRQESLRDLRQEMQASVGTEKIKKSQRFSLVGSMRSIMVDMVDFSDGYSSEDTEEQVHKVGNVKVHKSSFHKLRTLSTDVLEEMKQSWSVSGLTGLNLKASSPLSRSPITNPSDAILVSESWNKILAFRSMFAEALVGRWRMLAAIEEIQASEAPRFQPPGYEHFKLFAFKSPVPNSFRETVEDSVEERAIAMIESNKDPIAKCFETRTADLDILIIGAIDAAVRELCPRNQVIQREAYRPLNGSADPDPSISQIFFHEDECTTFDDFCSLFARYGLQPRCWIALCRSFLWAIEHQNPYIIDDEKDDLNQASNQSAHARFISGMVALPLLEATLRRASYVKKQIFRELRACCSFDQMENSFDTMSKQMFNKLFDEFPEIADHFSETDVEEMSFGLFKMVNALVQDSDGEMSDPESDLRSLLRDQSAKWTELGLPTHAFFLIGKGVLDEFAPLFHRESEEPEGLNNALAFLWGEAMQFVLHPVLFHQNLMSEASRFYEDVAKELNWSLQVLQKRMFEVNMEIAATGEYTHTKEELEIGARLAWRNSAKCIGRIAWNTLVVRDRRHCKQPNEIFREVSEHLKMATDGTNIQSVMTVFRPQKYNEIFGMRFWSSQFVRYAGYIDDNSTGQVLGDPANTAFTSYLIEQGLWKPPVQRSAFDVLPLVLKLPGNSIPFVYELAKNVTHEVCLEHPKFPKVKALKYKWAAVPAISNFKMTLGGITYAAAPFNGWFVSIEVARNLLERYEATMPLAIAMGMDPADRFLSQKVSAELETAILHSFEANEFTMVDPMAVGKSFITHCKREKSAGRECPAQWSWIGGLVGPTNPTWHLEMRDFRKTPQYDYCCEPWLVFNIESDITNNRADTRLVNQIIRADDDEDEVRSLDLPKVLIAYGSETGTAEAVATSLGRRLKVCQPSIMTLNFASGLKDFDSYSHMLIVCSTFGQGEPPFNAKEFVSVDLAGKISNINFAVLALGSSLYPDFCKAGEDIYSKMEEAGAKSIINLTCADAAQGQNTEILNWSVLVKKMLLPDSLILHLQSRGMEDEVASRTPSYTLKWHEDENCSDTFQLMNIGTMQCSKNRELFRYEGGTDRSARHIELEAPQGAEYETGDHLSVTPANPIGMVSRFCACFSHELEIAAVRSGYYRLELAPIQRKFLKKTSDEMDMTQSLLWQIQQPFYVESVEKGGNSLYDNKMLTNRTLSEVLQLSVDLSFGADSYVIDLLQMLCTKLEEANVDRPTSRYFMKMAKVAIKFYNELGDCQRIEKIKMAFPTVVHFLEKFKQLFCVPLDTEEKPLINLADVLVMMPRLSPRHYSISSSGTSSPYKISITVGVLNYSTPAGVPGKGVCSHYLAGLKLGQTVNAKIIKSSFRPPQSLTNHMILIGAGTGLAPFVGFLADRASAMETFASKRDLFGQTHLFFGCKSDIEILYKDQLLAWESSGTITKFHLALSREDQIQKQYVQDAIENYGEELVQLLLSHPRQAPHVYICGDISMANGCREKIISVLQLHGRMSKLTATRFVANMRINNCWQMDVYSTGTTKVDGSDISYHNQSSLYLLLESRRTFAEDFALRPSLLA